MCVALLVLQAGLPAPWENVTRLHEALREALLARGVLPEERGGRKVRRGQQQDGEHRPEQAGGPTRDGVRSP